MGKPVDPVAVLRAAQGDRCVYDAMTGEERKTLWDWCYARGTHVEVGVLLGMDVHQRKLNREAAYNRLHRGNARSFDPQPWGDL